MQGAPTQVAEAFICCIIKEGEGGQGSDDEGVHGCDDVINIFALAVILPASIVTITHLVVS